MPIVRQLRDSYPWIADSLTAMVAGATGMAALLPFAPFALGIDCLGSYICIFTA